MVIDTSPYLGGKGRKKEVSLWIFRDREPGFVDREALLWDILDGWGLII